MSAITETDHLLVEIDEKDEAFLAWKESTPVEEFHNAINALRDLGYTTVKSSYYDLTWGREVMVIVK